MAKNEMLLVPKGDVEELMRRFRSIFSYFEDVDSLLSDDACITKDDMVAVYGKFLGMAEALVTLGLIEVDEYRHMTLQLSQLYQHALSLYCDRLVS